ncbi:MAG TPA: hypothetical protein VKR31_08285 [Rhizomicrobium sp.]|nr:hypothetical protein [Rhizomicrobium sp.]
MLARFGQQHGEPFGRNQFAGKGRQNHVVQLLFANGDGIGAGNASFQPV